MSFYKKYDFDLVVIGSGAAGRTAAISAAEMGRKVALVKLISTVREIEEEDKKVFSEKGIECFYDEANFKSAHKVVLKSGTVITGDKILIASGAKKNDGGIEGLTAVPHLTPENALKTKRRPKAVFIVGAGASGVELAQHFSELGSQVLIAEIAERLLPKEDEEVGELLEKYLEKRFRVKVLTSSRVVALEQDSLSKKVIFMRNGQEKVVRVEEIIIATGIKPVVEIGLEKAGVGFSQNGIKVDKTLMTSTKNIYAAGDVLGGDSSIEKAIYEASVAVANMFGKSKNQVNYDGFSRITNTMPQVAVVGLTEDDLVKRDRKYKKVIIPLEKINIATTVDFYTGFIKLLADKQGKILGATIVAPEAVSVIQELALAIRQGIPAVEIASTPHIANSWGELVRLATRAIVSKK